MADPEEKVEDKKQEQAEKNVSLRYPLDLLTGANDKAIRFGIFQYDKPSPRAREIKKNDTQVTLPIPPELSKSNQMNFTDFDGGFSQRALKAGTNNERDFARTINEHLNQLNQTKNLSMDQLSQFARQSYSGLKNGQAANLVGSIGNSLLGDEAAMASTYINRTLNAYTQAVFQSVGLREYQFQFSMIARSAKESDAIQKIIDTFEKHQFPEKINAIFLRMPSVFEFSFLPNKLNGYLFTPNPCGLVSMDVSYNGDSAPVFFQDTGAPVEVNLSLQFKELTQDTRETLNEKKKRRDREQVNEQ